MDVVWLKKDARLHDHGPLASVGPRPFCILYIYEPDQLAHHSCHGSQVNFCNEGLIDLDKRLRNIIKTKEPCITCSVGEATQVLSRLNRVTKIKRSVTPTG